jgi:ABC-2 type transport system permease protein
MTAVAQTASARPGAGSPLSTFVALMKREFWEHRGGLWSAQLWTVVVLLVLMVLSLLIGEAFRLKFVGNVDMSGISVLMLDRVGPAEMAQYRQGLEIGLWGLGMINQIVLYFVVLFYCIGTLYDERKDRSILFWKSLPATDTQTVLAKLATALLVAPVIALVAIAALQVGFLLLVGLYTALHGVNPLPFLWQPAIFGRVWSQMLVTIPVHLLWALPGIAWLLLASSWAKRTPFVWAILVPVLAGVFYAMIETAVRLKLPSNWFWEHVVARIFSSPGSMSLRPWQWQGRNPMAEAVSWERLGATATSVETWIGVVVGIGLIAAAIWLRRYRDDS